LRSKTFIAVAAVLVALVALAGLVLSYDHGHRDTIAKGVTVGGVDVGGLKRSAAEAKLRREILAGLRRTVVVDHGSRSWRLTAREARVATNLEATVDEALRRSRDGNAITRTFRGLTGGTVDARLEPKITYADSAIVRLLDRVRRAIDRKPVDATVSFTASGPHGTPSRTGLAVDASALHRRIKAALVSPTGGRRFAVTTRHIAPKVTTQEAADREGTGLVLHRGSYTLTLYEHLKKVKTYTVAVGAVGRETPAGLYHIQNKAVNPAWTKPHSDWVPKDQQGDVVPGGSPDNPLKARWLGIFDGAGIHGIDPSEYGSIGHAASHGCVRMRIPDVVDLYPRVPVGAPIYIA
jgi:lipoprotein-anchoring transpeptidase ErfK/SrfK